MPTCHSDHAHLQVQLPGGSLVIEQVEAEDAGRYRCRVANVAGMLYHDVNLIVRSGCGCMQLIIV